jgi:uncharacterized protein YcbX
MKIASLYRYPVKGLSPEPLDAAELRAGSYFPGDRLYAIENGPSGFEADTPQHQPKIKFLMLMRNEALARLRTRYEDETTTLIIEASEFQTVRADISTKEGRLTVEAFMRRYVPDALRGPPKVLAAPEGFRFTDARGGFVSIINLASVAAISEMVDQPVDPLRLRGNVLVDGIEPWAEFGLVGKILAGPSGTRLKITRRIPRCAATQVDPTTGLRDLDIPAALRRHLGHVDCGIYAEVLTSGQLTIGETLSVEPDRQGQFAL